MKEIHKLGFVDQHRRAPYLSYLLSGWGQTQTARYQVVPGLLLRGGVPRLSLCRGDLDPPLGLLRTLLITK